MGSPKQSMIREILARPSYADVVLAIIRGENYATVIARALKKKQPTVTGQIRELEALGIIEPVRRTKSQTYEVNWDTIVDVFFNFVEDFLRSTEQFIMREFGDASFLMPKRIRKKISEQGLASYVPRTFIRKFLRQYSDFSNYIEAKSKGIDEIAFSLFDAIMSLDEKEKARLAKVMGISKVTLEEIASVVAFAVSGNERAALLWFVDPELQGTAT